MIIKKSRLDFVKSAIWNDHQVTSWSGLIGSPKKESHIYDQQNFVPITWQFVYHTVVSWPICVSIHEQPRLKCQIRGPPWNRLAQEHNLEHSYAFQTLHHWVISSSPFILVITGPWSIAMTIQWCCTTFVVLMTLLKMIFRLQNLLRQWFGVQTLDSII